MNLQENKIKRIEKVIGWLSAKVLVEMRMEKTINKGWNKAFYFFVEEYFRLISTEKVISFPVVRTLYEHIRYITVEFDYFWELSFLADEFLKLRNLLVSNLDSGEERRNRGGTDEEDIQLSEISTALCQEVNKLMQIIEEGSR
ncbi:hypothetical protein [Aneurinibacillus uraniidurans]|uniref:hypothetical protein n=1 Tax=Aneurinibacillus uraniidurans TaxID=2966586 RepID=UPI00234B2DA6|nr:hypothetical protein [Aneurinibacillus sp. B1]WCN36801.1 hypothetical protein PO771_13110 [Aneurinibacillus sp. B1]